MRAGRMLGELWSSSPGKAGMILLGALTAASFWVVLSFPADFGPARWSNPTLWADAPRSAPPAWTNLFSRDLRVAHLESRVNQPTSRSSDGEGFESRYELLYELDADHPPTFLSFSVSDVIFKRSAPAVSATLTRPDGAEITLHREVIRGARPDESPPIHRHGDEPLRVALRADERATDQLVELFSTRYGVEVSRGEIERLYEGFLFGAPATGAGGAAGAGAAADGGGAGGTGAAADGGGAAGAGAAADGGGAAAASHASGASDVPDGFRMLKGKYRLAVVLAAAEPEDSIREVRIVIGGSVFGLMGTDALGRDLAQGLAFGLPVALLIGISTALVSTFLGMSLGLASGYFGGATDIAIQRAADIVSNVPVLPLLIFLVFIGGSRLWLILLVLVAFSWPGLTIMVRTMVLQLRTGQEVEAARALGSSGFRVISRHVLPHVASYILSQLVFSAPSAILAEAGLSFLGLGDPSIPTWGQILEYGFRTGAVFLGYWWWILPPGLAIVITAVAFMFLALGLEPVVDPRLRGRQSWRF